MLCKFNSIQCIGCSAAVALAIGGVLFEMIGPGLMHSVMGLGSAAFIPLLLCIDRDPEPKVTKEQEEEGGEGKGEEKKP